MGKKVRFEVGESVLYHRRPTKHQCPHCGYKHNSSRHVADIMVAEIRGVASIFGNFHCCNCAGIYPAPKSWYQLNVKGNLGYYIAVPHTLLEKFDTTVLYGAMK